MTIKNIMTPNPLTISPTASVTDAKVQMTRKGVNKLPVVDKGGELVGIITKNDILKASPSLATTLDMFEISYLLSRLTVEKVMVKEVVTVSENETIEGAARIMIEKNIGCLVVVEGGIVTGIVTESDLFRLFTSIFGSGTCGVRTTLVLDDKTGQIAKISNEIAKLSGNIVSVVTQELKSRENSSAERKRRMTIKVENITLPDMQKVLETLSLTPEDIRVV